MGGNTSSIVGIVLGVIIGVVAVATQQYYLLFTAAALVAGGAYGLAMQPQSADQAGNQAQELQIAAAQLGNPVPVVFGRGRVIPNFSDYDLSTFRVEEVRGETEGGKGGGKKQPDPIVGYDYFLQWEYLICMGPVDAIGQIYSVPGEVQMIDSPTPWSDFSTDTQEVTMEGEEEGGVARIYRGTSDQTREATGDAYEPKGMNYRNTCWALMGVGNSGFKMGRQPQPRTYHFTVERIPDTSLDNGDPSLIPSRASEDTGADAYHSANPVAAIYECLVNKVWGRGLSSDVINVESFIDAAEYFVENEIGFDFVWTQTEGIGNFLESIRRHFKLLLVWDGEQYIIRNLLNLNDTHAFIQILNENDLIDLKCTRPLWPSVVNEIRAEFVSSERAFRRDIVHAQNLAAFDILGGRHVPQRIALPGFAYRATTYNQAHRMLYEGSYPWLTSEWEMNRFKSQIQIGDCVRVDWQEFSSGTLTTYWLILKIEDGSADSENIKVTAIEDQQLVATLNGPALGEEIVNPVQAWTRIIPPDNADIDLHESPELNRDPIDPIGSIEVPAILTGGQQHRLLIIGEKPAKTTLGVQATYSLDDTDFDSLGSSNSLGITGELDADLPAFAIDRSDAGFEFTITNQALHGATLETVAVIQSPADDMIDLLRKELHFVIIGQEIMQVGLIEQVSGDTYRLRNIIRGLFGTNVRSHPMGSTLFYLRAKSFGVDGRSIPVGVPVYFKGNPIGQKGVTTTDGASFQPDHEGTANDTFYLAIGIRPLAPDVYDITDNGGDVDLRFRPRFFDKGGDVDDFWTVLDNPIADIGTLSFAVEQFDATMSSIQPEGQPVGVAHTYTPGALDDPESGLVAVNVTKESGVAHFRVFAVIDGRRSIDFAHFNL